MGGERYPQRRRVADIDRHVGVVGTLNRGRASGETDHTPATLEQNMRDGLTNSGRRAGDESEVGVHQVLRARDALVRHARGTMASVKRLAQRRSIHSIVCSDGDDPGPWFPAIPFIPNCDIHSLADHLQDDPPARFFGGMHHAFASVNAGRELARGFPQRFQGQRLFGFVAPRPEDLRVIVPMAMSVMPTIGIITVGG